MRRRKRRRIGFFCIKMTKRDYHHGFIFLNLSSSASTNVPAPPIGLLVRINQQAASSAKIFLHTLKVSSTRPKSYEIVNRPRPFTENQNHKCTKFTKVIFLPLMRLPLRRAVDRWQLEHHLCSTGDLLAEHNFSFICFPQAAALQEKSFADQKVTGRHLGGCDGYKLSMNIEQYWRNACLRNVFRIL